MCKSCVCLCLFEGFEPWLVFVKQRAYVGVLKGCDVFKIISVLTIPIGSDVELVLEICAKHAPSPQIADGPPTASRAIHPDGISSPATFEYTGQKNVWKVNVNATPNFYQNGNRPKGNEKYVHNCCRVFILFFLKKET